MKFRHFPFILEHASFCNRPFLQTVSNACLKSINAQKSACIVFNPIMVEGYAAFFSCTAVAQASGSMTASINNWLKLDDCLWLDPPWFN